MKDFFKNEFDLFKQEMGIVADFLFQPVDLGVTSPQMLKPSVSEITEKAEVSGFWANEFALFKNDLEKISDFLFQPIEVK